jgi:hypothetical protein
VVMIGHQDERKEDSLVLLWNFICVQWWMLLVLNWRRLMLLVWNGRRLVLLVLNGRCLILASHLLIYVRLLCLLCLILLMHLLLVTLNVLRWCLLLILRRWSGIWIRMVLRNFIWVWHLVLTLKSWHKLMQVPCCLCFNLRHHSGSSHLACWDVLATVLQQPGVESPPVVSAQTPSIHRE